jgi:hypothetical protein
MRLLLSGTVCNKNENQPDLRGKLLGVFPGKVEGKFPGIVLQKTPRKSPDKSRP